MPENFSVSEETIVDTMMDSVPSNTFSTIQTSEYNRPFTITGNNLAAEFSEVMGVTVTSGQTLYSRWVD